MALNDRQVNPILQALMARQMQGPQQRPPMMSAPPPGAAPMMPPSQSPQQPAQGLLGQGGGMGGLGGLMQNPMMMQMLKQKMGGAPTPMPGGASSGMGPGGGVDAAMGRFAGAIPNSLQDMELPPELKWFLQGGGGGGV